MKEMEVFFKIIILLIAFSCHNSNVSKSPIIGFEIKEKPDITEVICYSPNLNHKFFFLIE